MFSPHYLLQQQLPHHSNVSYYNTRAEDINIYIHTHTINIKKGLLKPSRKFHDSILTDERNHDLIFGKQFKVQSIRRSQDGNNPEINKQQK